MTREEMAQRIVELEAQVEAATAKRARKAKESRPCHCGCGYTTKATFAMGHDAKHRGNLLRLVDMGDEAAAHDLIGHGWETAESIAERAYIMDEKRAAKIAREIKAEAAKVAKAEKESAKVAAE